MNKQLFKGTVPRDIIVKFINEYCVREGKWHMFSKSCFRKAVYHDHITELCCSISEYYHVSKRYYVLREINYTRFTTILRQLCKQHNILYTSRVVYDKSKYEIIYYIDMNEQQD